MDKDRTQDTRTATLREVLTELDALAAAAAVTGDTGARGLDMARAAVKALLVSCCGGDV